MKHLIFLTLLLTACAHQPKTTCELYEKEGTSIVECSDGSFVIVPDASCEFKNIDLECKRLTK